jgi:Asp-tRNA(Asn)/Glu-tRNA(Gln) amidotransferase A subunit family amidase
VVTATHLQLLTAAEAARWMREGRLTSEELVEACLDRIEAREAEVGAWEFLDRRRALDQARRRDREARLGALHGVPVGVKDIIDTADMPTTYGSPIYRGHLPEREADSVVRLRRAGAVILGKTVTTEFAVYHPGRTRNPLDHQRTPGGSSSGSAAAVADAMVPAALGSQTAGSTIRPAAYCGIFGFKPTYGTLSRAGVWRLSDTLDTLGVLARAVEDLALLCQVMAGPDPGFFPLEVSSPPRLAFVRTPHWDAVEPPVQKLIEGAADELARAGAPIDEVDTPPSFEDLAQAQMTIMDVEVAGSLSSLYERRGDAVSASLRELIERGLATSAESYEQALELAGRGRGELPELFAGHDVLLAPAVSGEAPAGLESTGDPLHCRAWTLLGLPAAAVPGLEGPEGMPVGVQLVGPRGDDRGVLRAAHWVAAQLEHEG